MIENKKDLKLYIQKDFEVQKMEHPLWAKLSYGENYAMYSYMRNLRYLEFYKNKKKKTPIDYLLYMYRLLKYRKQCLKYQIHIEPNSVGYGFAMIHPGFRRVGYAMKIGNYCTILPNVLLGRKSPDVSADKLIIEIGDNCYLGTGCSIMGPLTLGNNVTVGAGSVVTKSFPDNVVIAGNPAKIIKYKE